MKIWPATHGLEAQELILSNRYKGSSVDWTSTHAALVSQTKTAHELHQLPRRKMGHGRTRTKHGRLAAKNAKTREEKYPATYGTYGDVTD
ncbi:MAG: hypothetical protein NT166_21955 [Candidatus Aminicenantes bacterium]|nr:hypothetical protein [Candidatus Aminicenantes bacterium]